MPTWAAGESRKPWIRADIVICPRVTDAAVVIGPAASSLTGSATTMTPWLVRWLRVILSSAGPSVVEATMPFRGGCQGRNVGYPIAEVGQAELPPITKHPGTGRGLISRGHGEAQLLYEISTPAYYNPDVIAHFDTMQIVQVGEDRVLCKWLPEATVRHRRTRCASTSRPA